jgi:hypothetical protein
MSTVICGYLRTNEIFVAAATNTYPGIRSSNAGTAQSIQPKGTFFPLSTRAMALRYLTSAAATSPSTAG